VLKKNRFAHTWIIGCSAVMLPCLCGVLAFIVSTFLSFKIEPPLLDVSARRLNDEEVDIAFASEAGWPLTWYENKFPPSPIRHREHTCSATLCIELNVGTVHGYSLSIVRAVNEGFKTPAFWLDILFWTVASAAVLWGPGAIVGLLKGRKST